MNQSQTGKGCCSSLECTCRAATQAYINTLPHSIHWSHTATSGIVEIDSKSEITDLKNRLQVVEAELAALKAAK